LVILIIGLTLIVFLISNLSKFDFRFRADQPDIVYEEDRSDLPRVSFQIVRPGRISIVNHDRQPVNLTRWIIKGNIGSYMIVQGAAVYNPSGFNAVGDIFLEPGAALHIYSQAGPINQHFQVNVCLGYLENTMVFNPPLPKICPRFSQEEIASLSGACQRYLRSLPRCALPEDNVPFWNNYACAEKLRQLNYKSCFEKYSEDPDFLTGEWRLYGSGQVLDPLHDQVLLLDTENRVVDQYGY